MAEAAEAGSLPSGRALREQTFLHAIGIGTLSLPLILCFVAPALRIEGQHLPVFLQGVALVFLPLTLLSRFVYRHWLAPAERYLDLREGGDVAAQVRPYDQLINLIRFFQAWEVLRFDEHSATRFQEFRRNRVRIGTLDLKIACIALEQGAMMLSANVTDFNQVPGLRVEDWLH